MILCLNVLLETDENYNEKYVGNYIKLLIKNISLRDTEKLGFF